MLNSICADSSHLAVETGAGILNSMQSAGSCWPHLAQFECTQRRAVHLPPCAESHHRLVDLAHLPLFGQSRHKMCEQGCGLCPRGGRIPPALPALLLPSQSTRDILQLRGPAGEEALRVSGTSSQALILQSCPSTSRMAQSRGHHLRIDPADGHQAATVE